MKDAELKRSCLEHAGEDLSPEHRAYLARHPEVQNEVDELAAVSRLISLKKYEIPDPGMKAECMARVHERIVEGKSRRWWLQWEDTLTFHPAPVWAAAVALALVAGGLWVQLHRAEDMPALAESMIDEAPVMVTEPLVRIDPVQTNPVELADMDLPRNGKPVVVFQVASNAHPSRSNGGVQYGPGPSMPVSFGY